MATPGKTEQEHKYLVLKQIGGINTQPSREALTPQEALWMENLMPIGKAFIKVVPTVGAQANTMTASVQAMHPATIGTKNYQIFFTTTGGAQAFNVADSSVVTITSGGTFTGTPAMDQWKSERIVICDTNNFYSWDGSLFYQSGSLATISVTVGGSGYTSTPTVVLTGGTTGTTASATATLSGGAVSSISLVTVGAGYTAAPAVTFSGGAGTGTTASAFIMPTGMNGDAVSVYSGRVWVANGRLLSYTAPNTWYDVATADAAGSTTITEGSLRQKIYGLQALDNYLYVFGDSSIIVIGDLKVTGSITTFSQTFLSSTTGTTLPNTITSMERAILFANQYGVYALFGASVQKVSKALDGIFPDIVFDTSHPHPLTAGLVQIYNILCYVMSFHYTGSLNGSINNRHIQAVLFDGKWFLTSQGDNIEWVAPISVNGVWQLWCSSGTDIRQMYSDTSSAISSTLITGLYDLGNPIFDKQVVNSGIEYTAPASSSLTLEIDTEDATLSQQSTTGSTLVWYNNAGNTITWVNNSNNAITWIATGFLLDHFPTAISGKYLGATVTSDSPQVVINGIILEYVERAPWGP